MVIFLGHVKLFQNCMDLTWLRIHLSYGNLLSLAAFSFVLFICLYLFKKFYFCKLQVVSVPPYPLLPICISGGIFWNSRSFPKTRVRPFSFSFWTLIPEVGVVVREYFWMLCLKIVLNVEVVLCLLSWFFFFSQLDQPCYTMLWIWQVLEIVYGQTLESWSSWCTYHEQL